MSYFEYDSLNPFNPIKYGNKKFSFEGKRLTKYENTSIKIEYLYNEQGLRTEKKFSSGSRIKFVYDSNKLISEIGDAYRLDFLYDDSGLLYGFILDKDHKYFYLRDVFGNILGILDEKKSLIVKYKYNAWGEITEIISDSDTDIGELNPFKFKGYYYDRESSMYYCKSRYYVPEWCRWLNADNPKYLDFKDVKGTNLFVYCQNDPILGMDENGRFVFQIIAFSLFCGLLAVIGTVVESAVKGEEITIKSLFTSFIGGAVGGLVVGITGSNGSPLACYASAAAESIAGEVYDYITGVKQFNFENIEKSINKIVSQTMIEGTIGLLSDKLTQAVFPKMDINFSIGSRVKGETDFNLSGLMLDEIKDSFFELTYETIDNELKDLLFNISSGGSDSAIETNPIVVFN